MMEDQGNWFKRHKLATGVLGFVLAMCIVAVATGGNKSLSQQAAKAGSGSSVQSGSGSSQGLSVPAAAAGKTVLLNTAGVGNTFSSTFTTKDAWQVTYQFDCSSQSEPLFQLFSYDNGQLSATLASTIDKSGSGTTQASGEGDHYLEVSSPCNWHLTIAQ